MPVDIHPEEKIPGVELILTRLHAGGKFSNKNYTFSGGLHGVGVSVVNALSKQVEVFIKRDGNEYRMDFARRRPRLASSKSSARVGKKNTGTRLRFWPDPKYFDTPKFNLRALQAPAARQGRALPRPDGAACSTKPAASATNGIYEDGLRDYLQAANSAGQRTAAAGTVRRLAEEGHRSRRLGRRLAARRRAGAGKLRQPDPHRAARHPRQRPAHRASPMRCASSATSATCCRAASSWRRKTCGIASRFVLSVKMTDPQFSGQTKERLSSRQAAGFVEGAAHDAFSLWLNQHTEMGERIAQLAIERASARLKTEKQIVRKKVTQGPALPGKLADCISQDLVAHRTVPGRRRFRRRQRASRRATRTSRRSCRCAARSSTPGKSRPAACSPRTEVHDLAVAIGCDPGKDDISGLRYGKVIILADADSDGLHIATLLTALFLQAFPGAGRRRPHLRGDAAAVPRRRGQAGVLRAGRGRKAPAAGAHRTREDQGRGHTSPASRAWAR